MCTATVPFCNRSVPLKEFGTVNRTQYHNRSVPLTEVCTLAKFIPYRNCALPLTECIYMYIYTYLFSKIYSYTYLYIYVYIYQIANPYKHKHKNNHDYKHKHTRKHTFKHTKLIYIYIHGGGRERRAGTRKRTR